MLTPFHVNANADTTTAPLDLRIHEGVDWTDIQAGTGQTRSGASPLALCRTEQNRDSPTPPSCRKTLPAPTECYRSSCRPERSGITTSEDRRTDMYTLKIGRTERITAMFGPAGTPSFSHRPRYSRRVRDEVGDVLKPTARGTTLAVCRRTRTWREDGGPAGGRPRRRRDLGTAWLLGPNGDTMERVTP